MQVPSLSVFSSGDLFIPCPIAAQRAQLVALQRLRTRCNSHGCAEMPKSSSLTSQTPERIWTCSLVSLDADVSDDGC